MKRGFAFVELLIVFALLAVFVTVATPQFSRARQHSANAQVHLTLRTVARALEAYALENNSLYPYDGQSQDPPLPSDVYYGSEIKWTFGQAHLNNMLTTPVAYLESRYLTDPTLYAGAMRTMRYINVSGTYSSASRAAYGARYRQLYGSWALLASGPDGLVGPMPDPSLPGAPYWCPVRYDPSNGLLSYGDIVYSQRSMIDERPASLL